MKYVLRYESAGETSPPRRPRISLRTSRGCTNFTPAASC
jgi:hypothetical protein